MVPFFKKGGFQELAKGTKLALNLDRWGGWAKSNKMSLAWRNVKYYNRGGKKIDHITRGIIPHCCNATVRMTLETGGNTTDRTMVRQLTLQKEEGVSMTIKVRVRETVSYFKILLM